MGKELQKVSERIRDRKFYKLKERMIAYYSKSESNKYSENKSIITVEIFSLFQTNQKYTICFYLKFNSFQNMSNLSGKTKHVPVWKY